MPAGEYILEIDASDYHGNEAETVTLAVTLGDEPIAPPDTDGDDGGGTTTDAGTSSTGLGGGDAGTSGPVTDGGGSASGTMDDSTGAPDPTSASSSGGDGQPGAVEPVVGGCSSDRTHGRAGGLVLMLGLLGLCLRRRRSSPL
ncbi:MAG: hypothetical protein KUG77_29285 [Nannocystaceae bacterium]|nr:hypothetical protein [Nannocystaceae bacterium]